MSKPGAYHVIDPPETRMVALRERLAKSASGFVLVSRFGQAQRGALRKLIAAGEVEIFESPLGRAYRLVRGRR